MNQAQKRKKKSAALAVVLATALALTGTFAWQSISQTALNEAEDKANPGGRLHDDFSGYNILGAENVTGKAKNIYVENFTDPDNGGLPIYARVKLTEYMEIGEDAGSRDADKAATPLVAGTTIDDKSGWTPYGKTMADNPFREYWNLKHGGSVRYLPTFNKNKDSLQADINGTLEGKDGVPYADFVLYWSESQKFTDTEYYDADSNNVDEGDSGVEGTNYTTVPNVKHQVKRTSGATFMTMDEWIAAGAKSGEYWVIDETDGWAYWAAPIDPGTATGCLLNSVTLKKPMDENWYYALNATGQFVTAFDWGSAEGGGSGFYKDGETVSDKAQILLNKAAGAHYMVAVEGEDKAITYMDKGGAAVDLKIYVEETGSALNGVTWKIDDRTGLETGTAITEAGSLTIDANEEYETKFKVTGYLTGTDMAIAEQEIVIENDGLNSLRNIPTGSYATTATIDGIEWYVVARDTSKENATDVLLFAKEPTEKRVFSSNNKNDWNTSDLRTYLNSEDIGGWLADKTTLKEVAATKDIYTRRPYDASNPYDGTDGDFIKTEDRVFIPSAADITGDVEAANGVAALSAKDYTFKGETLAAKNEPLMPVEMSKFKAVIEWQDKGITFNTRTPADSSWQTWQFTYDGRYGCFYQANLEQCVRPATWVTLTK